MKHLDFSKQVIKPIMVGTIGGVFAQMMYGDASTVPLLGRQVSPIMAIGTSIGVASVASELAHDVLFPHLHINHRLSDMSYALYAPAMTAAASYFSTTLLIGQVGKPLELGGIGGAAEVAGTYAYTSMVKLDPELFDD